MARPQGGTIHNLTEYSPVLPDPKGMQYIMTQIWCEKKKKNWKGRGKGKEKERRKKKAKVKALESLVRLEPGSVVSEDDTLTYWATSP